MCLDSILCCSSFRSTTGRWGHWVYFTTEAGWWWMKTACASVRRECRICASFSHKSTCPQTNYSCRRQVRQSVGGSLKKHAASPKDISIYELSFAKIFVFFVALQEWSPFQFPWNTTPQCTHAIQHVRAKFVVTGELARLKHAKAAAGGNWETYLLSCLSLISNSSWLCLSTVDGDIRPPALSFIWILSVIYY